MSWRAEVAGRFARQALESGEGEVCAVFRRSFYLRSPSGGYACVGDDALGAGPLNALLAAPAMPVLGARLSVDVAHARLWEPPRPSSVADLERIREAARDRVPEQGLGCLILGMHNSLSGHAQPALDALERWLAGNALETEVEQLIGLGPGLTPSGDDFLGGVLVALRLAGRRMQAEGLWRWLAPRLEARTNAISAAHLAAAAAGEAHEALHEVLGGRVQLDRIAAVGHCSGWDALAGAVTALRTC